MDSETTVRLIAPLLALQFASFGWRINREITVGDQRRRTWLPLPDYINVISMLMVVTFAIIAPLIHHKMEAAEGIVIGVAYVFLAFHPITMAAHYRLWSKAGRSIYPGDYPWITGQELASAAVSICFATFVGFMLAR